MSEPEVPHYALPRELIATHPPADRDGGRLMVLRRGAGGVEHRAVGELPELLAPGDLLVVNDTRVMAARLRARRTTGGAVELLLLEPGPGPVQAMVRPGRRLKPGEVLSVQRGGAAAGEVTLLERLEGGEWRVRCAPEPAALMAAAGEVPLPPYLERAEEPGDRLRYQTVYASEPGAVAAPTAGLHLSERLLAALDRRGVGLARVTLHVGPGTFRPLRPEDLQRGELHRERWQIPAATAAADAAARVRGGRVVAVGTTATRALESATPEGARVPAAGEGNTGLFIRDGYRFRCVDALLTNFHLPGSSLLMLVCAFAGRAPTMAAYREAVARSYRFYSYGDAMLLL